MGSYPYVLWILLKFAFWKLIAGFSSIFLGGWDLWVVNRSSTKRTLMSSQLGKYFMLGKPWVKTLILLIPKFPNCIAEELLCMAHLLTFEGHNRKCKVVWLTLAWLCTSFFLPPSLLGLPISWGPPSLPFYQPGLLCLGMLQRTIPYFPPSLEWEEDSESGPQPWHGPCPL